MLPDSVPAVLLNLGVVTSRCKWRTFLKQCCVGTTSLVSVSFDCVLLEIPRRTVCCDFDISACSLIYSSLRGAYLFESLNLFSGHSNYGLQTVSCVWSTTAAHFMCSAWIRTGYGDREFREALVRFLLFAIEDSRPDFVLGSYGTDGCRGEDFGGKVRCLRGVRYLRTSLWVQSTTRLRPWVTN